MSLSQGREFCAEAWPYSVNGIRFSLLVYRGASIRQNMYINIYDDKGRIYQLINFMNLVAGVLMLRRGGISHYGECALSSTFSIKIRDYYFIIEFVCYCGFFLYSKMGLHVYMQI